MRYGKARFLLSDMLEKKEHINDMMYVSGQVCIIKAGYENSKIVGQLNLLHTNKKLDFEFD